MFYPVSIVFAAKAAIVHSPGGTNSALPTESARACRRAITK